MTPIEALVEEHRLILKALDLLEAAAARLEAGEPVADAWWHALLDWLRGFADARHHAKEENVLFPAMVRCGAPERGGPVDVMLEEHVDGRALLAAMADGNPAHRATTARQYVRLLRDHIDKENGVLFPFAQAIFDPATVVVVQREFATADAATDRTLAPALAESTLERLGAALEVASGAR